MYIFNLRDLMEKRLSLLVALTGLCFVVGCGSGGPTLVPATGTVYYQDKPLEGAAVTFVPDLGVQSAGGTTDAEGKFTLKTGNEDGAAAGSYKVVVVKVEGGGAGEAVTDPKAMSLKGADSVQANEAAVDVKSLIPESYNSPATSGFTATVEEGKPNDFEFRLK